VPYRRTRVPRSTLTIAGASERFFSARARVYNSTARGLTTRKRVAGAKDNVSYRRARVSRWAPPIAGAWKRVFSARARVSTASPQGFTTRKRVARPTSTVLGRSDRENLLSPSDR
jgi:hypothetical protein